MDLRKCTTQELVHELAKRGDEVIISGIWRCNVAEELELHLDMPHVRDGICDDWYDGFDSALELIWRDLAEFYGSTRFLYREHDDIMDSINKFV